MKTILNFFKCCKFCKNQWMIILRDPPPPLRKKNNNTNIWYMYVVDVYNYIFRQTCLMNMVRLLLRYLQPHNRSMATYRSSTRTSSPTSTTSCNNCSNSYRYCSNRWCHKGLPHPRGWPQWWRGYHQVV